jgi:hypothetical protein
MFIAIKLINMTSFDKAKDLIKKFENQIYITYCEKEKRQIVQNGIKYNHALHFAYITANELRILCLNERQFELAHFYSEVQLHINKMQNKIILNAH